MLLKPSHHLFQFVVMVFLPSLSWISAHADALEIYSSGRIASLTVTPTQYAGYNSLSHSEAEEIATVLYQSFKDDFDFIFLLNNEDDIQTAPNPEYYGAHLNIKNDTQGIGQGIYDISANYGSEGRLQGILHFPARNLLRNGPSLHEIVHRWANDILTTSMGGHWGFSSVGKAYGGQLGGFARDTLTLISGNTYSANNGRANSLSFGEFANGGNTLPYGELELYLMGLIPAAEVSDVYVAMNPRWGADYTTFTADGFDIYSIDNIIQENGARTPDHTQSQKSFRGLVVVLTTEPLTEAQWQEVDSEAEFLGYQGDDNNYYYNFWEATRGLATLNLGGLHNSFKTSVSSSTAYLTNISTRANVSGGQNDAFAGFVVSGTGTQQVMLRGIAVDSGTDPNLTLLKFNGATWESVAVNDEWEADSNAGDVGNLPSALQLPDTFNNDAGLLLHLDPGVYSAQLSSNGSAGLMTVGVDAVDTASANPKLVNISTRAYVSGGQNDAFAAFVISGSGSLKVMLRGIAVDSGTDPSITLLKFNGATWDTVDSNDEWELHRSASGISALATALQLPDNFGNDAGMLLDLSAGVYSVQLSSAADSGLMAVGVDEVE